MIQYAADEVGAVYKKGQEWYSILAQAGGPAKQRGLTAPARPSDGTEYVIHIII